MIGQTTKFVGTFETDEGIYVYVEEHAIPAMTTMTAAPIGSPSRRTEFGPFDAATAQQKYAVLCRMYPMGMPTPAMTGTVLSLT